jgi:hypothetical protein
VAGEVTTNVEGTVKLHAFVPSPTTIFEPVPETVQDAPMDGVALLRMLKVTPFDVKFAGAVPVPSVFEPQFDKVSRLPVDLE